MGLSLFFVLLFSLFLIGAPIGLNIAGHPLGAFPSMIMLASGIVVALVSSVLLTIMKLFVKTKASEAFVRTGMGGIKVIRDGGALVIPVVHELVRVPLGTQRIPVQRQGADALITADKLRGDVAAEFFVRVMAQDEDIQSAARSLGSTTSDVRREVTYEDRIRNLIEDKLISALRTAAARKTLEQLNSERDEFLKEVVGLVSGDLKHNGFTLETVSISKLDQTDEQHLKDGNIFDAQGKRTLAEITQRNLTERNKLVRSGEQEREAQDVETTKQILALNRAKAEAEARQAADVLTIQATQTQASKKAQIEAAQAVSIAEVGQQQAVEVARRAQQQAIEVAEREKMKAVTVADQQLEVAKRSQLQAIADADAKKAKAEAALADAEAEREKSRQNIVTVQTVETAERDKRKAVIAAQGEAEKAYVQAEKAADANAYKVQKEADARKASAEADAMATTRKAEADKTAQIAAAQAVQAKLEAEAAGTRARLLAEADGQRAVAMVPVDVKAKEVDVEQRRVTEVLKPELQARADHGEAAQKFELAKFQIEKEASVRIEAAKAMVNIYGKITANVYGTPEDVARMGSAFSKGMGLAHAINGFLDSSGDVADALEKTVVKVGNVVAAASAKEASE